ncbi:YjfK family protein [Vibrio genomosp. F10]|uniref:YjfK family protein n=1 Tax=Vibrio genomosp. F10 TaxID=723171 RepID=UPI0002F8EBC4|nr:YjfK family protein [Vibrio genomosp. F10]OEF08746.1 hypothetical protein A1QK_22080 [Vibrio genomosp. F10 str. 9ZD137]
MFTWFKKKTTEPKETSDTAPEVLGLRLGGAFELDDLKFRMIEPELVIEGASRTQIIQAVGVVSLDENTRLVRFYTDDDGYLQVLQHGRDDSGVAEVKLFYFYETKPIDSDSLWDSWLNSTLVQPSMSLEGHTFEKVWENEQPVAMTEKTYDREGRVSQTDQFVMLYERDVNDHYAESLLIACEESVKNQHQLERCVTHITGVNVSATDFTVIG